MRSSNNLALIFCLATSGCGGGGYADAPPRLGSPTYADPAVAPTYPQPGAQVAPQNAPQTPPLTAEGGPPPATGPSGTSGSSPERYDEVGYATWYGDELGGARTASGAKFDPDAFTAAHRSLPLGSFVEVTSLDTGRTILVQVNDRGPSDRGLLIDLSRASAQSLGISGRAGVRVRRVTPSPDDDAAIRAGRPGAPRLDTPPALLSGLKQRLKGAPSPVAPRLAKPVVSDVPSQPISSKPGKKPAPAVVVKAPPSAVAKTPAPPLVAGNGYYVQVAAFSNQQRAAALAKSMGGSAQSFGSLWRVRLGPYASAGQAAQARDGAAKRGYGDAKVVHGD